MKKKEIIEYEQFKRGIDDKLRLIESAIEDYEQVRDFNTFGFPVANISSVVIEELMRHYKDIGYSVKLTNDGFCQLTFVNVLQTIKERLVA